MSTNTLTSQPQKQNGSPELLPGKLLLEKPNTAVSKVLSLAAQALNQTDQNWNPLTTYLESLWEALDPWRSRSYRSVGRAQKVASTLRRLDRLFLSVANLRAKECQDLWGLSWSLCKPRVVHHGSWNYHSQYEVAPPSILHSCLSEGAQEMAALRYGWKEENAEDYKWTVSLVHEWIKSLAALFHNQVSQEELGIASMKASRRIFDSLSHKPLCS